jgi:transcription elongation factor GreB
MSKNYLTPEGHKKLQTELHLLLHNERPQTVQAVSEAAAMGDRSENAEYIYGKKRLREIDRRIRFLSKRLENIEIIDPRSVSTDKVSFGVWVVIQDENGNKQRLQIVGEDEIDPNKGRITFSSPMGRALLGKQRGDYFVLKRPKGDLEIEILDIQKED